jgi:hypothetical protein
MIKTRAPYAAVAAAALFLTPEAAAAKRAPMPPLSTVFEAPGLSTQVLMQRASTCIPQNMKPGYVTAPVIQSTDLEQGKIVAIGVVEIGQVKVHLAYIEPAMQLRSTLTFEAKDGRFRITHADAQGFIPKVGWTSAQTKPGEPGPPKVVEALQKLTQAIADCLRDDGSGW